MKTLCSQCSVSQFNSKLSSGKLLLSLLAIDFVVPIVDISASFEAITLSGDIVSGMGDGGGCGSLFGVVTRRFTEINTGYLSSESK